MNTEKPLKVQKPGKVTMADLLRLRHSEARSNGMYFPTRPRFSERLGWERVTKPKIFAPSEEPPVGGLLEYLKPDDFQEDPSSRRFRPVVTDCRVVASYNWLDTAEPTIAVPGKPPRWTPLRDPRQLKPDGGEYFSDYNAARYPEHPLEPTIIAALVSQAEIAMHVDIIACGKTLEQLLDFICGTDKMFRMLIELVEGSVFFVRRENSPFERLSNVRGYGHSFPEAYTTWDDEVKSSTTNHRIISYQLGGLNFLVRSRGDGYLPDESDERGESVCESWASARPGIQEMANAVTEDVLSDRLAAGHLAPYAPAKGRKKLRVLCTGELVRQDRVFELKTRSIRRKEGPAFEDTFTEQLPRLWVSQTPNFILAYHQHGLFEEIHINNVDSDIKEWERRQAGKLSRFAALIHRIVEMVKARPDGKLELRHVVPGRLEVREQLADAGHALSQRVHAMWVQARKGDSKSFAADDVGDDGEEDDGSAFHGLEEDDGADIDPDYTACSADRCGYCGRCSY